MKKLLCFAVFFGLLIGNPLILQGQNKKANDPCSNDAECGKGYYCVEVEVKGIKKKVCSKCDRSTLDNYKRDIDDICKGKDSGWTPSSSWEYKEATARDGRVEADIFDVLIEKAEECIRARQERENKCFEGGDPIHKDEINRIRENSIKKINEHKATQYRDGRLIYCSKYNYENALDDYESKCKTNDTNFFPQKIRDEIGKARTASGRNEKINCIDLEKCMQQCYECYEAAKDLLEDCFDGKESQFPKNFKNVMTTAKSYFDDADRLLDNIKSKKLCK